MITMFAVAQLQENNDLDHLFSLFVLGKLVSRWTLRVHQHLCCRIRH